MVDPENGNQAEVSKNHKNLWIFCRTSLAGLKVFGLVVFVAGNSLLLLVMMQ